MTTNLAGCWTDLFTPRLAGFAEEQRHIYIPDMTHALEIPEDCTPLLTLCGQPPPRARPLLPLQRPVDKRYILIRRASRARQAHGLRDPETTRPEQSTSNQTKKPTKKHECPGQGRPGSNMVRRERWWRDETAGRTRKTISSCR